LIFLGPNDFFATEDENIIPCQPLEEEKKKLLKLFALSTAICTASYLCRPGGGRRSERLDTGAPMVSPEAGGGLATSTKKLYFHR
jgi:hypothetical protein